MQYDQQLYLFNNKLQGNLPLPRVAWSSVVLLKANDKVRIYPKRLPCFNNSKTHVTSQSHRYGNKYWLNLIAAGTFIISWSLYAIKIALSHTLFTYMYVMHTYIHVHAVCDTGIHKMYCHKHNKLYIIRQSSLSMYLVCGYNDLNIVWYNHHLNTKSAYWLSTPYIKRLHHKINLESAVVSLKSGREGLKQADN